jgi:formylglycine-generating enzyme required for sulfatase activity
MMASTRVLHDTDGCEYRYVEPGAFSMGTDWGIDGEWPDGRPKHRVTLTRPFYLGVHPITYAQFVGFLHESGYEMQGDDAWSPWNRPYPFAELPDLERTPVVWVSRYDVQAYCDVLTRTRNRRYRLPTEAEWEYACRSGTTTRYFFGDDPRDMNHYVWCSANSGGRPRAVGTKKPNHWGFYDMLGNVWEWCSDSIGPYPVEPVIDPTGYGADDYTVIRGGSYGNKNPSCAFRLDLRADARVPFVGFRVVIDP